MRYGMMILIAVSALFVLAGPVQAATYEFDGDCVTDPNDWSIGENWDADSVPVTNADTAKIGSGALTPATAYLDDNGGMIRTLIVGDGTGEVGTFEIRNGGLLDAYFNIGVGAGAGSTGTLNVLAGGLLEGGYGNANALEIGDGLGSQGYMNVTGTVDLTTVDTNGVLDVGNDGDGELHVSGDGVVKCRGMIIGFGYTDADGSGPESNNDAVGLLTITDDGAVTIGVSDLKLAQFSTATTPWIVRITDDIGDNPSLHVEDDAYFRKAGIYQPQISGDNIDFDIADKFWIWEGSATQIEPLALSGLPSGDYTVMTYDSVNIRTQTPTGTVTILDTDPSGTWTIKEIGDTALVLSYEVIPEPGTLLLVGTGVLGVIGYLRRRKIG